MRVFLLRKHEEDTQPDDSNTNTQIPQFKGGILTEPLILARDPLEPLEAATKQYTDILKSGLEYVYLNLDKKLDKSGGVMTGYLMLNADPIDNLHAATKRYVDNTFSKHTSNDVIHITPEQNNFLNSISVSPNEINQLSGIRSEIKSQLSNKINKYGDTLTGHLTLSRNPVQNLESVTKQYLENLVNSHASNTNIHITPEEKQFLYSITATSDEINQLSGINSNVQNQIDTKLNKSGGVMNDYLTLHSDPINDMHVATKRYVDSKQVDSRVVAVVKMLDITPNNFNVNSGTLRTWTVYGFSALVDSFIDYFEVNWGDGSSIEVFPAVNDSADISHTYTGNIGDTYTLSVRAIDKYGHVSLTINEQVKIVNNQPAIINNITWSNSTLISNGIYTVTIDATDPDGDPLTYSVSCNNPGVIISNTAQPNVKQITLPSVTSDTTVTFTYQVSDGTSITTQTENKTIVKPDTIVICQIDNEYSNNDDIITGISIYNNEIYVCGHTYYSDINEYRGYIAKFDANLNPIKQITIENNLMLKDIAIDSNGYLYTIAIKGETGYYNIYIGKFDSNLNSVKQITLNADSYYRINEINCIKIDSNDNVFIAGSSRDDSKFHFYIAKLDSNLNVIKQKAIEESNSMKFVTDIAIDSANNIYITGTYYSFSTYTNDIYIAKLDNNLNIIKQIYTYKSANSGYEKISLYGITVDNNDNVFVGGTFAKNSPYSDFYIVKLTNNLEIVKEIIIDNEVSYNDDVINKLIVDNNGYVYAVGRTNNGDFSFGLYVIKLDNDLSPIKQITINNSMTDTSNNSQLTDIVLDSLGNIYVAGCIYDRALKNDFFLAKINLDSIPTGTINVTGDYTYLVETHDWNVTTNSTAITENVNTYLVSRNFPVSQVSLATSVKNWLSYISKY